MKEIQLTQGKVALVDDEDFEYLNQWKWYAKYDSSTKSFYAVRRERGKDNKVLMHRVIMNTPRELCVDHKNHDTLNNTKSNLRNCTRSENNTNKRLQKNNKTGYKGVSLRIDGRFLASFRRKYIGLFNTAEEAARAYDDKAREYGVFSKTNFNQ